MDPELQLAAYNKFVAEGTTFEQGNMIPQAIDCYTNAIEAVSEAGVLQNDIAKTCMCLRSRCYLKMGDHASALKDAEWALEVDKAFIKGFHAKAEALYQKGDFENALLFFQRGYQMRPDVKDFVLGKQKAREAIDNAIGSPKRCELTAEGNLDIYYQGLEDIKAAKAKGKKKGSKPTAKKQIRGRSAKNQNKEKNTKSMKQLLGELYVDRAYLEELMNDKTLSLGNGKDIKSLAKNGLQYLDKRTEFWRQQKPIYARVNERKQQKLARTMRNTLKKTSQPQHHIDDSELLQRATAAVEQATTQYEKQAYDQCIAKCESACALDGNSSDSKIQSLVAAAFSLKGCCYLEKNDLPEAEAAFIKDVAISVELGDDSASFRATSNLGRCRAAAKSFKAASDAWKEARKYKSTPQQTAWLLHELGRALLETGDYEEALDVASAAIESAEEADSRNWLLFSTILKGQVQEKLGDRTDALATYGDAADIAGSLYKRNVRAALENEKDRLRDALAHVGESSKATDDDAASNNDQDNNNDDATAAAEDGDEDEDDAPETA